MWKTDQTRNLDRCAGTLCSACSAYLQLGQLALSSPPLLRGKVARLNGLCEIELAAFMRFVQGLQLTLQSQHLHADMSTGIHEHRQT